MAKKITIKSESGNSGQTTIKPNIKKVHKENKIQKIVKPLNKAEQRRKKRS